ncbi:glycosyltransferase family A protein [Flavobacterium lindanitolerans]|uniref:Glycosyl transferase family 2 n=1 Tax=Flavobacterium lindanitolerans TaxID=428988 RepID=A0A497UCG8_9FLAO|nr:glycosyltransferase family A protein [Flavobacterium lindanitolerans]PKW20293.1 glycosyl transferase family 2 [Flavobacterium lindanitolerans]RLJ23749.1 glycosyl transferase family 2 [Flavobacterium lindanitolerans]
MIEDKKYILSVIIPTRNRETYAYMSVMHILQTTDDDVQVVIQDNSDTNSLINKFENNEFRNRIKYNYSEGVLSFVDNFSKGVEGADGEYICMIGDDDGINPEIVEVVRWAKENGIEAITPEIRLNYIWPNTGISYYKNDNGNLMIVNFNLEARFYDTKKELQKLLDSGGQNYLKYNLVKIYHGIVRKSAMDKVKQVTGRYFGGLSPDIYSSVALSLVIDKVLKIDYPLTIPGVCRKSGAGHSSTGRHHGKLEDAPQLVGHTNYQWSSLVPRFYSVETLWADSALAGFVEMQKDDFVKKFNVSTLSAYCFYNYKEFDEFTEINYNQYCAARKINLIGKKSKLLKGYLVGPLKDLFNRGYNKLTRKKDAVEKFEGIETIDGAEKILSQYLKRKSLSAAIMIEKLNRLNK